MSEDKVAARYVQWGSGKWHAWRTDSKKTCCGREVPDKVRLTIYSPSLCAKCEAADPDGCALAEETRKADWAKSSDLYRERIAAEHGGEFKVIRCRTCGQQLSGPGPRTCLPPDGPPHSSDPEEVVAVGPAWVAGGRR